MYTDKRQNNIAMFNDTLNIFKQGEYFIGNKKITLPKRDYEALTTVYLPDDTIQTATDVSFTHSDNVCQFICENRDSFALAMSLIRKYQCKVAVLNMASPVNPGGGVQKGSQAQEEDLCRKSSLYLSLSSNTAKQYYDYNRSLKSCIGANSAVYTNGVDIIKDSSGNLFKNIAECGVVTCAAPKLSKETSEKLFAYSKTSIPENMQIVFAMSKYSNGVPETCTFKQYKEILKSRIQTILEVLAANGQQYVVLSAWGCGAFGNNAAVVASAFKDVFNTFRFNGYTFNELFKVVAFGVYDKTQSQYNFKQFVNLFN